jgi:hypothetical protein
METKICGRCKIEKEVSEFYYQKTCNRYRTKCKICYKLECKIYKDANKDKTKAYSKNYRSVNAEIIKEKNKIYREENKEEIKIRQKISSKKYYDKNTELVKGKSKKFRENNPNYAYEYRAKNQSYSNDYQKNRRNEDQLFKLNHNVKARLSVFLKKNNITKKNKTFELVGCTPQELKEHLEKQFREGMTWENHVKYGWNIDHIIPLSSATTEEELYKLCHFTNLQPLWAEENLSKGNRIL